MQKLEVRCLTFRLSQEETEVACFRLPNRTRFTVNMGFGFPLRTVSNIGIPDGGCH
jgi:hypothetical protein